MVHLLTREELTTLVDKDKGIWLLTQNPGKPHDERFGDSGSVSQDKRRSEGYLW
jgi:hypothetical protein|nr:hypothetical protein [uncultured Acetatifactor sp.]